MTAPFTVVRKDPLHLNAAVPLRDFYQLSPFVWKSRDGYELLVRAVNHAEIAAEKVARIYHGVSPDGIAFAMDADPVIAPGPDDFDRDGCEDPTHAFRDGIHYVYYSGWNQSTLQGQLLLASGPDIHDLTKHGIALASTPEVANPKEATIVPVKDGTWRLFFEYARGNASRIGVARSDSVGGPWTVLDDLFQSRPQSWDSWHLSTGPILLSDPDRPVMFYNGATQKAMWRIGWVAFDATFERVVDRCDDPLIVPHDLMSGDTDIAFAASCTDFGKQRCELFYSVADKAMYRVVLHCT